MGWNPNRFYEDYRLIKVEAHRTGEAFIHEPKQVYWATSGDDPSGTSALQVAMRLNMTGSQVHFVYNPVSGEIVEMTSRSLKCRLFSDCEALSVVVVGSSEKPFTGFENRTLPLLLKMLPRVSDWPSGPPTGVPVRKKPRKPGHYSACQIPGSLSGVGSIDTRRFSVSEEPEEMPEDIEVPEGIEDVSQETDWIDEEADDEEEDFEE